MMGWLPDGSLAQIQYARNVPPWVAFAPEPLAARYYGPASTFAMLDRISAEMEAAALYQATTYTNRERRHLWSSRPSIWFSFRPSPIS